MKLKTIRAAFPYTVPVLLGYISLGIAFGILLTSQGYPFWLTALMSVFIYAGSMQFVTINLLTGGASLLSAALMTLMVNARHLFYGLSMLEKFKTMGKKKPYMIYSLTDETYSILCGVEPPSGVERNSFYFWISLLNHSYWVLGSVVGAVAGTLISFNTKGIDFALTALFVVIFVEQWETNKNHLPALIGLAVTLICLIIFGSTNFIVFSMVGILILLCAGKPIMDKHEKGGDVPC